MGNQNSSFVIPADTIRVEIRVDRSCSNLAGAYTIAPDFHEELRGLISIENYIAEINRMNQALVTTVFERITPYSNLFVFVLVTLIVLFGRLSAAVLLLLLIFVIAISGIFVRIGARARFQRLKDVINEINRLHTILEYSYGSFQTSQNLYGDSTTGLNDNRNRHHFIDIHVRRSHAYEFSDNLNIEMLHSVVPVISAVNISPYSTDFRTNSNVVLQHQNNQDTFLHLANVSIIDNQGEPLQDSFQFIVVAHADPVL